MKNYKLFLAAMLFAMPVIALKAQVIQLKFSALLNGTHVNIDSVRVTDIPHPGDTVLYWPDTTLILGYVGTGGLLAHDPATFGIQLVSANPVAEEAVIQVIIPAGGNVNLRASDISGRILREISQTLPEGIHSFRYRPSQRGVSIITAAFGPESKSLKIIYSGIERPGNSLVYSGYASRQDGRLNSQKNGMSSQTFVYSLGDSLSIKGWYNGHNIIQLTAPQTSTNYFFNFYMNVPCPGMPSFVYGGKTYHTVQIGTQCWMKENLNIGTMVNSVSTGMPHSECSNNAIIEKYCYDNDTANCTIYGGLYDWDEMMQYTLVQGTQGICPSGWHLPSDPEWCILSGYLGPGSNCADISWPGSAVGGMLKETGTVHWFTPNTGATNESGFTGLPGGSRDYTGEFTTLTGSANFWSSNEGPNQGGSSWYLYYLNNLVKRFEWDKTFGFSVRCIKN